MFRLRTLPFLIRRISKVAEGKASDELSLRERSLRSLTDRGISPYPYFKRSSQYCCSIEDLENRYGQLYRSEQWDDSIICVTGRILSVRELGSKLVFYDIEKNGRTLQIIANQHYFTNIKEFKHHLDTLRRGDVIEIHGVAGKTHTGQLSLRASQMRLLAPCLHRIPEKETLHDAVIRQKQRYLDLLSNAKSSQKLRTRFEVIRFLRQFLEDRQFIEVETPILSTFVGGAIARPFVTYSQALDTSLHLRISPELHLKELIIGGLEKIFEIGKQFRNEGLSPSHYVEFTTCELYEAYTSLDDLFSLTETFLHGLSRNICGRSTTIYQGMELNFEPPYRRIEVIPFLEEKLSQTLPLSVGDLVELLRHYHLPLPEIKTVPKLLDCLIGHFIEPECQQPTFICYHPTIMSPLAKELHPGISARFELFVAGYELINAYSELNDPFEQHSRFVQQSADKERGDLEAHSMNDDYCHALEYGLPPTGGWGLGIDRLLMILTDSKTLKDVISFSLLRQKEQL